MSEPMPTAEAGSPRPWTLWLWPTLPGLALPGLWAVYVAYLALRGGFAGLPEVLVALWPLLPLYAGACLLAGSQRRGRRAGLAALIATAALLAAAELALKVWLETSFPYGEPVWIVPGLFGICRIHNEAGNMWQIPNIVWLITALSAAMVPVSILGYAYLRRREPVTVWMQLTFVGILSGSLAKAGDLLWRGRIVDYLYIPGLPIADLADIYLIWIGIAGVIAASLVTRDS